MVVLPFTHADLNFPKASSGDVPIRASISGVQDKAELSQADGGFEVVQSGGDYILKPIPSMPLPRFHDEVPLNEALTMKIAKEIFGIQTAENEIVSFQDGELAYMTKRFDKRNGVKIVQEDFCQLSGRTARSHGSAYKYDASYEECGGIVRRYCAAKEEELPKLFRRILFSYVISNGDAHLKNFSLYESERGDMVLTPAYDLVATSVHILTESALALDLFADGHFTKEYENLGFYSSQDFLELGRCFGIEEERVRGEIELMRNGEAQVAEAVEASMLSTEMKIAYMTAFHERLKAIGQ